MLLVVRMWHGTSQLFQSATSLQESFPQDIPHTDDFQMGYIEGNVKRWIFEDQDLQVMWCVHVSCKNNKSQEKK